MTSHSCGEHGERYLRAFSGGMACIACLLYPDEEPEEPDATDWSAYPDPPEDLDLAAMHETVPVGREATFGRHVQRRRIEARTSVCELAAVAFLSVMCIEMAEADGDITDEERERILAALDSIERAAA